MNEKDIQKLIDLARERLREQLSPSEALEALVAAGILDKDGHYTANYPHLAMLDSQ
jgi:hypothetical protein